MYNMSGSASSAKFRRDRLEASQTNRQKLSESNSVACARPQVPALINNNNNNNNNNNKQALYDDTHQGQGQGLGQGQGQGQSQVQININKSDNDLRALGAMPPVTILKLHEQRLNLNATLLAQLTKQVEDCQKIKQVPLNNTPNTTPTINNVSNDIALTSRITDLEQKMSRLLQPSTVSTPVVVVPEVSKQQFDALSLKCTNMEGQLHTLMTTIHSLNEQRIFIQTNQTKQPGTDEHDKQYKQDKQEKRIDLLQSLIVTQRDLVSDISVMVKTFSNTQKQFSCEPIINNQLDGICMSKGTQSFPFSGQDVLPLLGVLPEMDVVSVLPAMDVVSVLPEVVTLTEVTVDDVNADELLSNEPELSDVTSDIVESSPQVLKGESDTINVSLSPHSPRSHQNTFTDTLERQVESKLEVQKLTTQPTKTGRKSKRTVNI